MSEQFPTGIAVEIADLRVIRGDNTVIAGLSLTIERGEVVGLLGPSGSGKTTLMRSVVGVQQVKSGTVTVLGTPAGDPAVRSRVGYVTQAASVYVDLTVAENVRYFGALSGALPTAVERAIDTVDLGEFTDRIVGSLSGGQRGRVSLAAALVGEPELLVLDEPTVGLDPVLRRDLWATFRSLAADGVTLIVSSHVMDEADECDTIILLRDGVMIARETPQALRDETGTDNLGDAFLHLIEQKAEPR